MLKAAPGHSPGHQVLVLNLPKTGRVMIEEYLKGTKTEIWIEHDFVHNAKLKKSPQYYD